MRKFLRLSKVKIFFLFAALFGAALFLYLAENTRSTLVYDSENNNQAMFEQKKEEPPRPRHLETPPQVRGVYMTSWVAGTPSLRDRLIDFVENSQINSIVIDVKDYSGKIAFETDDPVITKMESAEKRIPDVRGLIEGLHQNGIYTIARVTVFQDPYMAKRRPDLAMKDTRGGLWKDRKGLAYIDPGAEEYWDYIVHIARVSESVGFDEINFDYIRFPSDGSISTMSSPYLQGRAKADVLEGFFIYLRKELADIKVPLSADLFGLTTYNTDDLNIGQVLEKAAPHFDYVAPMVYPSHYANGFNGFKNPAEHPYEVINVSLEKGVLRLKAMGEDPKKLRPWIQDFDLGRAYGVPEIEQQIKAIYDNGLDSWMAWDASNVYTKEAYAKPKN